MSKRTVFEEVGAAKPAAPVPASKAKQPARAAIAAWFWLLAALVAIMVLVGGLTRLTDSGLSITVWDPVMGAIPPLSAQEWDATFQAYQQTTEFQEQNDWMTLADFKPIFWWEWGHRFLGRLIGVVWLVGFVAFLAMGRIPAGWKGKMLGIGLLGGLQGAVGWWMVSSGLDQLDVASYRLAIHLGLAFLIFMVLIWFALKIRLDEVAALQARRRRIAPVLGLGGMLAALIFLQILTGALVAGIDAGRGYIDWPLMNGYFLPPESFELVPFWTNFFENPALVQFVHRMLGYLVGIAGLIFAARALRSSVGAVRRWGGLVGLAVVAQIVIGIVTVMHGAPLEIAIFHQAGALVLVAVLMRAKFEAAYPVEEKIARG
ncbi:COX15/CtaA family protein [Rhodobacteraceae bacterium NNCM2]|nr:COX15/CtaA family protein [Coraliihabitans acroporae]